MVLPPKTRIFVSNFINLLRRAENSHHNTVFFFISSDSNLGLFGCHAGLTLTNCA